MSKRKYVKKSDYWNKFDSDKDNSLDGYIKSQSNNVEPVSAGEPFYLESKANYSRNASRGDNSVSRKNYIHSNDKKNRFSNISGGLLPYTYSTDGVDVRESK